MTGIVDFRTSLLDDNGDPITSLNPLPTTGGGGGGAALSDVVFVDSTGQLFVYRDTGSGVPTAYEVPGWTSYSPVAPISAAPVDATLVGVDDAAPLPVKDTDLEFLLVRVLNALNAPQGYDKSLQRQRGTMILESGTVTTVNTVTTITTLTTCSTVNNLATIDTLQGRLQVYGANLSAWADCVRSRIT